MRRTSRISHTESAPGLAADTHGARTVAIRSLLLKLALVASGVGLMAASAWISVPFFPVPMTMQTLAVLLVGGLLGPRLGVTSVASYLALGLAGAPVFHGGLAGPALLVGPTGGYLIGFIPAAYLMGLFSGHGSRTKSVGRFGMFSRVLLLVGGALSAEAAIYALGLPWLAFTTVHDAGKTVAVGLTPFLLGDLVKTAAAVMAVYGGKNLLARWGSLPF
jgi:biotin transport system substrate-specific component